MVRAKRSWETVMAEDIKEKIEAVKQAIADLKASQTSCVTNVEKEYKLMELEDEMVELKSQLTEAKQQG